MEKENDEVTTERAYRVKEEGACAIFTGDRKRHYQVSV
jgi:hypothetical protein